jgi:hypothetical protein
MKMAENLTNLDAILVPAGGADAFNPENLDSLLRLFSVGTNGPAPKN